MTYPLARWIDAMSLHPWHAYQLADAIIIPVSAGCSTLVYERAYRVADRVGRAEIRQAIAEAERLIHDHGGFWPTPHGATYTTRWPASTTTRWPTVTVPDPPLLRVGALVETTINATASLTYSDLDADGLAETATATVTVPTGTVADEIAVTFLAADCGPVLPEPEIVPRRIVVAGTTATLTFDTWTLVRPVRTSGWSLAALDPTILPPASGTPFAASVRVVRRTRDAAEAVTLTWLPCDACAETTTTTTCATILDRDAGIVAVTGEVTVSCGRLPDLVTVAYEAGLDDGSYDLVVARLAAAILARPVCACDGANKEIYTWQQDLSRTGATNELFAAPAALNNPFGTRRGHVYAWQQIVRDQRLAAISAG